MHNTRAAQPGEFSKRAFYNGKADLLHFEGINLIKAETENQEVLQINKYMARIQKNALIRAREYLKILQLLTLVLNLLTIQMI